ncbi:cytochrome d ubiquinol oxidase subunit II [Paractinoplanes globisporus]|uniref:Cytochrome d ubiquinol oxidase subunit II n=1 Tax=Paractinoplanes globisporus TaxID=113565 RepID=A0ABW6WYC2_9ACTN|nr:cytochrome d ubiquinol oxidase subunit II [Actinoplanes globisporus]
MTAAEAVAGVLLLVIIVYACTGVADYGAGFWDLTAGGRDRGRRPRELIDAAVTPVWEANHVWLIFLLILCWTAFGPAFASITTTLFVPLALALLGIVLRAASFAMRKDAARAGARHVAGYLFGVGSVLTPFFLGAALGGLLAGRVPEGNAAGNELTSWFNPISLATGLLVLLTGAFLSAVYLIAEARRRGAPDLQGYFRTRALVAGVAGLIAGGAALGALLAGQRTMFDRVIGRSWPLLVLGVLALAVSFWLAVRGVTRGLRLVAAAGVAALVAAWGVAQYPYLLPFSVTISEAAGAPATLRWVLVCSLLAVLTVGPALTLLFVLDQRERVGEDPTTSREATVGTRG